MVIIDLELRDASHAGSSWALSHWLHREGALEPGHRQILRAGAQRNVPRDTCAEAQSPPVITLSLLMPLHLPEDPGLRGKQNTHPRNNQRASSGKATRSQGQSSYPTKKFLSFLLPSISVRQHWVGGHGMSQAWWGVAVCTQKDSWLSQQGAILSSLSLPLHLSRHESLWLSLAHRHTQDSTPSLQKPNNHLRMLRACMIHTSSYAHAASSVTSQTLRF